MQSSIALSAVKALSPVPSTCCSSAAGIHMNSGNVLSATSGLSGRLIRQQRKLWQGPMQRCCAAVLLVADLAAAAIC